jgi:hypothetical protein
MGRKDIWTELAIRRSLDDPEARFSCEKTIARKTH